MKGRPTQEVVQAQIAALATMGNGELQDRWRELFKIEPPFKIRSGFLRSAIAYRLQEQASGGLPTKVVRAMARRTSELRLLRVERSPGEAHSTARIERTVLSPGTRLLREWNGTTEAVDVVDGGFEWRGKTYASLSAVAAAVTGTKWSGPAFFGLKSRPGRPPGRAGAPSPSGVDVKPIEKVQRR